MEPNQSSSLFDMQVDGATQNRLNTISTWARFIAISLLTMLGCSAIFLFIARDKIMDLFTNVLDFDIATRSLLIAITAIGIGYFIVWFAFLLKAAISIRQGIKTMNSERLADGFKSARIFFTLSAIYSILSMIGSLIGLLNF